jgi:hypothetical protein
LHLFPLCLEKDECERKSYCVVAGSPQPLHANGSKPDYAKNIHDKAQPHQLFAMLSWDIRTRLPCEPL